MKSSSKSGIVSSEANAYFNSGALYPGVEAYNVVI